MHLADGPSVAYKSSRPSGSSIFWPAGDRQTNLFGAAGEWSLEEADWSRKADSIAGSFVLSSVLMNVVSWVATMGAEAEVRVLNRETMEDAPAGEALLELLSSAGGEPGQWTWATLMGYLLYGNSWWQLQERNGMGQPSMLGFMPPWLVRPEANTNAAGVQRTMSSYWRLNQERLLPSEVLHVRNGIDLWDTRLGLPPARQIVSEIMLDAKAAGYSTEVLRNLGYAANILIPEFAIDPDDAEKAAKKFSLDFGAGSRASTFMPALPMKHSMMKADVFAGADLKDLRNICEERVCSAYRLQPSVVGFGTGMEQVKMGATMIASVRLSWRAGVVPALTAIRRQVKAQLFPMFGLDPMRYDFVFESGAIAALQEDPMERARRLSLSLNKGAWMTVNEARRAEGLDPLDDPMYDEIPEPQPMTGMPGSEDEDGEDV